MSQEILGTPIDINVTQHPAGDAKYRQPEASLFHPPENFLDPEPCSFTIPREVLDIIGDICGNGDFLQGFQQGGGGSVDYGIPPNPPIRNRYQHSLRLLFPPASATGRHAFRCLPGLRLCGFHGGLPVPSLPAALSIEGAWLGPEGAIDRVGGGNCVRDLPLVLPLEPLVLPPARWRLGKSRTYGKDGRYGTYGGPGSGGYREMGNSGEDPGRSVESEARPL